jgi:DNA polymerase III gamma/tau subunit
VSDELYKKLRPKTLKTVVGQEAACATLSTFGRDKMPHTVLLTGASGCGKTTLARIAAAQIRCDPSEVQEVNCADNRGIELARDLKKRAYSFPLTGDRKAWILDEVHALTKDAQSAMLKLLEDTPPHVYFFLCTTDPQKLLPTIITRCTEIKVKVVSPTGIKSILERAIKAYRLTVSDDAVSAVVNESDGSPRKALVLLNQIKDITDPEEQAEAVEKASFRATAILIARAMTNPRVAWPEVAKLLKDLTDEVETVRHVVLGYFRSILLGGGALAPRAALVIERFSEPFYESKAAGLALACYEIVVLSKKT